MDVSTAGGTGKLTGLTPGAAYEASTDGRKTWVSRTADTSGQIAGLAPGTYIVHIEAGAGSFASENSNPVTIDAYKVKVTFMANGAKYKEITVDYGTALKDIPAVPPKKDAGDQTYTGEWCSDERGTPAVFTNITADGAYTIRDIRENQTVTVEGVAKKPGKPSGSGGDKEDGPNPGPEEKSGTDGQDAGTPETDSTDARTAGNRKQRQNHRDSDRRDGYFRKSARTG